MHADGSDPEKVVTLVAKYLGSPTVPENTQSSKISRKLAAILAADIAGYSALMGADEEATVQDLKAHQAVILPMIGAHGGRIIDTAGDGILAVFGSVMNAVDCAVTIQKAMAERNAAIPLERQMRLRIGISLADIIHDDARVYGDGVNIAARLENIADPGGICVSGEAYGQVHRKLPLRFIDLGEQHLKNIGQSVRVYRIEDENFAAATAPLKPALALPDKPSIAVLPFTNLSGDPQQEYLADGMADDIITALSRLRWLFVIARNSTLMYKGKAIDVRAIGRELGVRYVLDGSVRRSGNHVRVTGQLSETETAANVWADRYDGEFGDVFALQDQITMNVIGAVEPSLRKAEIERALRKRPDNLNAYDLFLRALPFATTAMPENADKALHFLEEAIRLEPGYATVHGFIAWCHEQRYLRAGLHAATHAAALHHAHAAIEMGGDDAMALAMGGFVVGVLERDYQTALDALDRSLALSPSSALTFGFSSIIRAWMGDDSTAIEHAKLGIRLSPYDPLIYLPNVGLAYAQFFAGNFVGAASAAGRASAANPRFSVPRYLHTAALMRLGKNDEAASIAKVLLELQPGFTISGLVSGNITTPERMKLLADALHQAGLPE
jgi:adenylate cyclase